MKMQTRIFDSEYTEVGFFKEGIVVSLTKCHDHCMGKKSSFWRVDDGCRTVSSLHRTKAEAMASAKKYLKKKVA